MSEWLKTPWVLETWKALVSNLPKLGIALAILLGGWLAAFIVSRIVLGALNRTSVDDRIAAYLGVDDGSRVERFVAKVVYYVGLGFVAIAFFNYLGITAVTAPLVTALNGLAGAVPGLLKAVAIGFIGFVIATALKRLIVSILGKVDLEKRMQKISGEDQHKPEPTDKSKGAKKKKGSKSDAPLAQTLGDVVYWFVLAVTAVPVLEALKIGVLAAPLSQAFSKLTAILPRIIAAAVLLLLGYLLGLLARRVVSGVLHRIGLDRGVSRLGFGALAKKHRLSDIAGAVAMAFVLLHFALSAVGRLGIEEISTPLRMMLESVYVYLPKVLVGALLMAIGLVAARVARNVAANLLAAMGFNTLMVHIGLYRSLTPEQKKQEETSKALLKERAEHREAGEEPSTDEPDVLLAGDESQHERTPADIAGIVIGALIVVLFLRQALGTMGLMGLAKLLDGLIAYLPFALSAIVVMGAGLWAGRWAHTRIDEVTQSSSDRLLRSLGMAAHIIVVSFACMVALQQLGVGRQLIAIAFALVLGSLCLALALAFGLGGREVAARLLAREYNLRRGSGRSMPPPKPEKSPSDH